MRKGSKNGGGLGEMEMKESRKGRKEKKEKREKRNGGSPSSLAAQSMPSADCEKNS
jgi:hypothetical protein